MRLARFAFFVTAVLLVVAIALGGQAEWKSDPKQSSHLAVAVSVDGFRLQPPKGYQMITKKGEGGEMAYAWTGATRQDGTRAMLMLGITPIKKGEKMTLEQMAAKIVDGIKQRRTTFHEDKPQRGKLGGMQFVRIAWSGKMGPFDTSGFHYVTRDGNRLVMLWSQDVLPAGASDLKVSEASIRTLRKG